MSGEIIRFNQDRSGPTRPAIPALRTVTAFGLPGALLGTIRVMGTSFWCLLLTPHRLRFLPGRREISSIFSEQSRSCRIGFRYQIAWCLAVVLCQSGCFRGPSGPVRPTRDEALRAGEEACRPVIAALEKYHSDHGRYPAGLDDLVSSQLLERIPETPEIDNFKRGGIVYETSPPVDLYRLSFTYDVQDGYLGAFVQFSYLSDEREWEGRKYPPRFWDEAIDRAAKRYRERRDEASLRVFIASVAAHPEHAFFLEDRVKKWFGEGELRTIPDDFPGENRKGICYGPKDGSTRICFTYRSESTPVAGGELIHYSVVDIIYMIESVAGSEKWTVLVSARPPITLDP